MLELSPERRVIGFGYWHRAPARTLKEGGMTLIWRNKKLIVCATSTLSALLILIDLLVACTAQPESVTEPATPTTQPSTSESKLLYVVVDTGQEKCCDNYREITCPQPGEAFYGQDAQYQGIQPAYQDNGDGTITDLNTGLMWQKSPDRNGDGAINSSDKLYYQEAADSATKFKLVGYTDWRLPTIKELYSLILFSGVEAAPEATSTDVCVPFIDTSYFDFGYGDLSAGERLIDAQYASSTLYVGTTMDGNRTMFGVNFADGRIKGYPADTQKKYYVQYVRGNTNYGMNQFIDNSDGTITDKATGLIWSNADSSEGMDWEGALAWVQQKNKENYLGYTDWRLPNAKELQSIVDYTRSPQTTNSAATDPMFNSTSITNEGGQKDYPFYWTSTTHSRGETAVYVSFGRCLGYMAQGSGSGGWTDVHGAGAQRSDPKSGDRKAYPS